MRRHLAVLALALLVPVAGAQAALRLGPDVAIPPPSGGFHLGALGCNQAPQYNPCTYLNAASTNPDVVVAAPSDGVITSWSFRAGCCLEQQDVPHHITLGTVRTSVVPGGYAYGTAYLTGDTFELPAGNLLVGEPTTLPTRLPIEAGETVGAIADHPIAFTVNDTFPGVTATVLSHGFTNGYQYPGATIYLSAQVEPDADHDGYGDETQDCAPADAAVHEGGGCAPAPPAGPGALPPNPISVSCNAPVCAGSTGGNGSGGGGSTTGAGTPVLIPGSGVPTSKPIAPPTDPDAVYIALTCPPSATQHCGGYLSVVPGGKAATARAAAAARTRYAIAPGRSARVKVPLTAKLRRQLKRKRRLTVTLRLQPDGGGKATTFTRTIKLKHKARS